MFGRNNSRKIIPTSEFLSELEPPHMLPPPPPLQQKSLQELDIGFYPIIDKKRISDLKYNKDGIKQVSRDDDLFLYFPIGKLKDINIQSMDNTIRSYIINNKRHFLSEIFPTLSDVPLDNLPLYVGINKKFGGTNNKSRKGKKVTKGRKSIKTRK
jgi:hypothetical protein